MSTDSSKPVFIVGSPRSGTTWLYHVLLSAGGFAVYRSETQVYSRFLPAFRRSSHSATRERFLNSWIRSEYFLRSGLDAEAFRRNLDDTAWTPGNFLDNFMGAICKQQEAGRWADCTPDHGLYIHRIKTDFPDAIFVHLVRDGRDVALSLAKQRFISPLPWGIRAPEAAAAVYWAWITGKIEKAGEKLGPDFLTVHYEDLIGSYEETLARLSEFTRQPMDPEVIASNSIGSIAQPNTSFVEAQSADGRDLARWKARSDPQLIGLIERLIGKELLSFGYSLSANHRPPPLTEELQRLLLRRKFGLGHLLRSRGLATLPSIPEGESDDGPEAPIDPTLRPGRNGELIRSIVRGVRPRVAIDPTDQ